MTNYYILGSEGTTPCLRRNVPSFQKQLGWVLSLLCKGLSYSSLHQEGLPFSKRLDSKPQRRIEMKKLGTANCGDPAHIRWDVSALHAVTGTPRMKAPGPAPHAAAAGPVLSKAGGVPFSMKSTFALVNSPKIHTAT